MYLITKPSGKKAYFSFRRLMKEENIEAYCLKSHDKIPTKDNLPARIAFNQIVIEQIEVDERV